MGSSIRTLIMVKVFFLVVLISFIVAEIPTILGDESSEFGVCELFCGQGNACKITGNDIECIGDEGMDYMEEYQEAYTSDDVHADERYLFRRNAEWIPKLVLFLVINGQSFSGIIRYD